VRRELEETAAAAGALGAYVATVLPATRRELRRWGPLPREKARNAEAVTVFATLAPRPARTTVVQAIVALQVAIDLRDALEERGEGLDRSAAARLRQLEASWRQAVASLPAGGVVASLLDAAVARCEEGQGQTHAAAANGPAALQSWAETLPAPVGYRWWELAAGASSSVAAHALIAAAADPAAGGQTAAAIDAAYFPPVGALTVFLDDLVDREADLAAGEHNYLAYYENPEEAAERFGQIAERAAMLTDRLPRSARHRAILAGVAAFYLSAPQTETVFARPIRERLLAGLGPGTRLLATFMRMRRLKERRRPEQAGNSPGL
jgi:tetraprenyl-beta-curcumene synthase